MIRRFLEQLKLSRVGRTISHIEHVPPIPPHYSEGPVALRPVLWEGLRHLGIGRLYFHQAQAITSLLERKNVVVATPTASGKTFVYNLPVLNHLLANPDARALYLFPYKALGQDQLKGLETLLKSLEGGEKITAAIYDGDTPRSEREKIRRNPPNILLTNPDMLHMGILAYHDKWEHFFRHLTYVVVDELHVYRGVFGAHVAQIFRRLKRLSDFYGSHYHYIACSATVDNPGELARALAGVDFEVIRESGAPKAGQYFCFLRPEGKASTVANEIFKQAIQSGLRTVVFTKARKMTELIYKWTTSDLPQLSKKISAYRAGFLPEERREIEQQLFSGKLIGVVSTSALEAGIDVGGLDVCILVGYPGTITSTLQRAGRVGRRDQESLVVLVAGEDMLDQYFLNNPKQLFTRRPEAAIVDPNNAIILQAHLICAAAELPLQREEIGQFGPEAGRVAAELAKENLLLESADGERWYSPGRAPQRLVSIRGLGENFAIIEEESQRPIGTIDTHRAYHECHPGAIYLHKGTSYQVASLDLVGKKAVCTRARAEYYTQTLSDKETEILEVLKVRPGQNFIVQFGRVKVTQTIKGYSKKSVSGGEVLSHHPLELPPMVFETKSVWFPIEEVIKDRLTKTGFHFMGAIHAAEHCLISIFPLFSLSDRSDLGGISYPAHPQLQKSAIFLYDGYPGGIGLCERGYSLLESLMEAALDIITQCPCEVGCPACIYSPKCGSGNTPLDKKGAQLLLELLLNRKSLTDPVAPSAPEVRPLEGKEAPVPATNPVRICYFDLETQRGSDDVGGWHNIHLMRMSVGIIWDSRDEKFYVFREEEAGKLLEHLQMADLVVGFNVKNFDYRVLSAYGPTNFGKIPTFDMLEDVQRLLGHRLKLDQLAQETLKVGKSADGLMALKWFKEGKMDEIIEYCKQDVDVTRRLFEHGVEKGFVMFDDRRKGKVKLNVNWKDAIPAPKAALEQSSLF